MLLLVLPVLYCIGRHLPPQTQPPPQAQPAGVKSTTATYPADLWSNPSHRAEVQIRQAAPLSEEEQAQIPWQNGAGAPPLGDSRARRGGVLKISNVGPYPANFLAFGSPAPQFFHYNLFECIDIPLIRQHPATGDIIPGLAEAWAIEGRTLHFRLNRRARYSNGRPVQAADFALGAALRAKAGNDGAWQRFAEIIEKLEIRGEDLLRITMRREIPLALLRAAAVMHPAEPVFYADFGSNYATHYASRIPPTTGAYTIEKQQRGRLIRLRRVPNWWGDSVPHFRNTCNVEAIEHHFLTDEAQAWELLRRGVLNLLQTRHLTGWMQKREEWAGVEQIQFTRSETNYPLPPYGIAMNAGTLSDINMRRGIAHALDMDTAILQVFCGEYERLDSFTNGYPWQNSKPPPMPDFDPAKARAFFAAAGYTQQGGDGILQRIDGTRLSISLLYPPSGRNAALMSILAQQARTCGLELRTEAVAWQFCERQIQEQKHQLIFWATVPAPFAPDYARYFGPHAGGHDAPFCRQSEKMQDLLNRYAACRSSAELAELSRSIDEEVTNACVWIPAWKENKAFTAHAAQVRFPANSQLFHTCDVADAHVLWIEE